MSSKPTWRTITLNMSKSNVDAQIAAFLYAMGIVHDSEEVMSISYGPMEDPSVPMEITIRRRLEVEVLKFNGEKKARLPKRV